MSVRTLQALASERSGIEEALNDLKAKDNILPKIMAVNQQVRWLTLPAKDHGLAYPGSWPCLCSSLTSVAALPLWQPYLCGSLTSVAALSLRQPYLCGSLVSAAALPLWQPCLSRNLAPLNSLAAETPAHLQ